MASKHTSSALIGATALIVALTGCGGPDEPSRGSPAGNSVRIAGFLFKPEKLAVPAGTSVTWTNSDDIEHTMTSGAPEAPTTEFDSGNKAMGETFSHTFATGGTFTYFCKNHTAMRGEVAVT